MTNTQFAVLIGFLIGVAWVAFGFSAALLGAIFAFVGYYVGKILDHQVNLQSLIQRYSR